MVQHKAHSVADRPRTEDIHISEDIDFKSLLLPKPILQGLIESGYKKPSPIQKQALPLVRCGLDLIIQAKAGTGKTCVFSVAALEMVQPNLPHLQAVILAPTREIALQITEVISAIGQNITGLKTSCFIGGYASSVDKEKAHKCQIAVGTPKRLRYLMQPPDGLLVTKRTRLFVLDEADKLMESSFVKDINAIYSCLPESKQVLACSATYTPELVKFLSAYMHNGQYLTPQSSTNSTVLLGVRQFVSLLPYHVNKLARLSRKQQHLLDLLSSVSFDQCLIFSSYHSRAEFVCEALRRKGWVAEWIAGSQSQYDRIKALTQLKEQKVRVMVTTDLTARGIDVENVNLIINLDLPLTHDTYLHRMGRAGRYGSHGLVISIINEGQELEKFQKLLGKIGGTSCVANVVPESLKNLDLWKTPESELKKIQGVLDEAQDESSSNDSIDSCEKCSKESSPETGVNECVTEGTPQDFCQCGSLEIEPESIEIVTGPSLFSVQEKDPNWQDVLPVIVNEYRVPLNTKVTLLGSKVVRVKQLDENLDNLSWKFHDIVEKNTLCDKRFQIDFESNSGTPSKILSFKEIKETLKTGTPECKVENHAEANETLEIRTPECEVENHEEIKETLEIGTPECEVENHEEIKETLETVTPVCKVETHEEINETLEIGTPECKVENNKKKENLPNYQALNHRLQEFQLRRENIKNFMKVFDSFDLVGWMAVDEKENILDSLKLDQSNVYRFDIVKCPSSKNHIKALNSFESTEVDEDNCDNISVLKLDEFKITPPISLKDIEKCLLSVKEKEIPKTTGKVERFQTKNKKNKHISLENGNNLGFKDQHKSRTKKSETHCCDARLKNGVGKQLELNTKFKEEETHPIILLDRNPNSADKVVTNNLNSTNRLKTSSPVNNRSCSQSSEYLSPCSCSEGENGSSKRNRERLDRGPVANGQDNVSRSEESESYMEISKIYLKGGQSCDSGDSPKSSSSDQTSYSEKNSRSSTCSELETFKPHRSKPEDQSSSSSSRCSYELSTEKTTKEGCIKLKRNCKNKDNTHHNLKHTKIVNVKSESSDSDISSGCSYQTSCSENEGSDHRTHHVSEKSSKFCKEVLYSRPSCSYSSQPTNSSRIYQASDNEKKSNKTVWPKSNLNEYTSQQYSHSTSNNTFSNCYQKKPHQQTAQETLQNKSKQSSHKVLTSYNLGQDWYSTWYTEVQRRAKQLELMEYIKTMGSTR